MLPSSVNRRRPAATDRSRWREERARAGLGCRRRSSSSSLCCCWDRCRSTRSRWRKTKIRLVAVVGWNMVRVASLGGAAATSIKSEGSQGVATQGEGGLDLAFLRSHAPHQYHRCQAPVVISVYSGRGTDRYAHVLYVYIRLYIYVGTRSLSLS